MPRLRIQTANRCGGFSVVELIVVVMIVLVITAIAIPSLMGARMRANSGAAVASIHTIEVAEIMYNAAYPDVGYAAKLPQLGGTAASCAAPNKNNGCFIMDPLLIAGLKHGYVFQLQGDGNVPDLSYTITATPASPFSGCCSFFGDQTGAISLSPPSPPPDSGGGQTAQPIDPKQRPWWRGLGF
jgi:type II secretory pathway pseudopilin PulG